MSKVSRRHVEPRNNTKTKYKNVLKTIKVIKIMEICIEKCNLLTYEVAKAVNVPFGMSVDGARKSPLILIPDKTPVTVGKNTPKTRNQVYSLS